MDEGAPVRGRPAAPAVLAGVLLAALGMALVGCGSGASTTPSPGPPSVTPSVVPSSTASSILDAAASLHLGAFVQAARAAGLDATLREKIPYTVLAPDDAAFRRMGLDKLVADSPRLEAVMDYNVLPAVDLQLGRVKDGRKVPSLYGSPVTFHVKNGAVRVNDADVLQVVRGPGWSIFVIDRVLTPPVMFTPSPTASS